MYRSGPNFEFGEKPVPKWYVPKWSCTELALTPRCDRISPGAQLRRVLCAIRCPLIMTLDPDSTPLGMPK